MKKYYILLGLDYTKKYTKDEIRKAFYKKVKTIHPDHNDSLDAKEDFCKLYEAYEELIKHNDINMDNNSPQSSNFMLFDKYLQYWLKLIFGDDMPFFIQNGYEPTGIFGPPYK